ncbi:MAG: hypothetical protein HOH13_09910 [Crocinitomicaceae bacterium]|jgi:hypothetical protein|nr:hypothetical protein [Crocinitomicaceae bacterium]MBT6030612.1 hypothetical protein [Crocinitomicaceae bacterium]
MPTKWAMPLKDCLSIEQSSPITFDCITARVYLEDYRKFMFMKWICTLLVLCLSTLSFGQKTDNSNSLSNSPFKDRLYTGGDLGLSLGNLTFVNVNPILGYMIDDELSAGVGLKYIYYRERYPEYNWEYSNSMFGGSIFARYLIGDSFIAHAELETMNAEVRPFLSTTLTRKWVPVGLLGGGYRQGVGNTYFQILVLYDAINDRDSPYRSEYLFGPSNLPIIIRGGLILGIGN